MRVAHVVVSDAFAGVERSIALLTAALTQNNVDVAVVGGHPETMGAAIADGVSFFPATTTLRAAKALARECSFDLVHAHMTAAEIAAVFTRPLHRTPIVSTRHFPLRRGSSAAVRALRPLFRTAIARQISISDFVANAIGEPSVTIHHGIDARPLGPHQTRTVLVAQRLEHEKQTDVALRAWALSRLGDDGWTLQVAGEGAQDTFLRALAVSLGVSASVQFLGFTPRVAELMDEAAFMIATTPIEAFGYSVVEAMAAGLPVVAADGGAHRETVGVAAPELLFPVGNAERCAEILRSLAADEALRSRLGLELQRDQRARFTLDAQVARTLAVYEDVLRQR